MRFLILNEVFAQDLIEIQFWNNLIEILNEKTQFFRKDLHFNAMGVY